MLQNWRGKKKKKAYKILNVENCDQPQLENKNKNPNPNIRIIKKKKRNNEQKLREIAIFFTSLYASLSKNFPIL